MLIRPRPTILITFLHRDVVQIADVFGYQARLVDLAGPVESTRDLAPFHVFVTFLLAFMGEL